MQKNDNLYWKITFKTQIKSPLILKYSDNRLAKKYKYLKEN